MNIDALVRAAVPPTADLDDPAVLRALDQLPARLRDTSVTPVTPDLARRPVLVRRRRARRLVIGVALVTSLAVAAPVAAATILAAHTGEFGNPHHEEGAGEFIELGSPQFPQVLDQIRKQEGLPLPPGSTWDGLPAKFAVGQETTSGIAGVVEYYAQCAWLNAYITAAHDGHAELQQQAAQVIEQIPQWPQMSKATDPGFRSQLTGAASAAAAGHVGDPNATDFEPGNIAQYYQVNCTSMAIGK